MGKDRITYLLQKYSLNKASRDEVAELFEWLQTAQGSEAMKEFILDPAREKEERSALSPEDSLPLSTDDWDRIWAGIKPVLEPVSVSDVDPYEAEPGLMTRKIRFFSGARLRIAAALFLLAMTGASFWLFVKGKTKNVSTQLATTLPYKNDIAPGGQRALLTLANGRTIVLDSAKDGMLAQQGGTPILKLDAGALAYNAKNRIPAGGNNPGTGKNAEEVLFNTIATPAGGQYQVVLADGSKVWLNASSSIRFPTAFTGNERSVELTGEAYFEIAPHAGLPFHVRVGGGMDVQVLGTNFNVMAYSNEQNIRTTLLEGAVKVIPVGSRDHSRDGEKREEGVKLLPGRQAVIDNQSHELKVADVNTEQVVAWKNGQFRFRETPIRELMRQVERWYDVKVIYQTDRKDQDYTGVVPLNQPVSALLQTLELTGTVHFRIEGRRIIVLP